MDPFVTLVSKLAQNLLGVSHSKDSVFVSSGYRSISATDIVAAPNVEPSYGVFHVGPVNIQRTLVLTWEADAVRHG